MKHIFTTLFLSTLLLTVSYSKSAYSAAKTDLYIKREGTQKGEMVYVTAFPKPSGQYALSLVYAYNAKPPLLGDGESYFVLDNNKQSPIYIEVTYVKDGVPQSDSELTLAAGTNQLNLITAPGGYLNVSSSIHNQD